MEYNRFAVKSRWRAGPFPTPNVTLNGFFTPKACHPTAQGRAAAKTQNAPWVTDHTTHEYTPKGFYK